MWGNMGVYMYVNERVTECLALIPPFYIFIYSRVRICVYVSRVWKRGNIIILSISILIFVSCFSLARTHPHYSLYSFTIHITNASLSLSLSPSSLLPLSSLSSLSLSHYPRLIGAQVSSSAGCAQGACEVLATTGAFVCEESALVNVSD